jgi:hypothetical protein
MQRLSRTEKMWLILFAVILIGLIGGCMYETVTNHRPLGPRPVRKVDTQSVLFRTERLSDPFRQIL